jgi:hypothetical protein
VDAKKLGRTEGGAGKRVRGGSHSHDNRTLTDRAGTRRNTVGREDVHVAADDYSRLADGGAQRPQGDHHHRRRFCSAEPSPTTGGIGSPSNGS